MTYSESEPDSSLAINSVSDFECSVYESRHLYLYFFSHCIYSLLNKTADIFFFQFSTESIVMQAMNVYFLLALYHLKSLS